MIILNPPTTTTITASSSIDRVCIFASRRLALPEFHRVCEDTLENIEAAIEDEAEDKLGDQFDIALAVHHLSLSLISLSGC